MLAAGAEPKPGTPDQFGVFLKNEIAKWRDLIKKADIRVD